MLAAAEFEKVQFRLILRSARVLPFIAIGISLLAANGLNAASSPSRLLIDRDGDGKYRIFVIGDSNTADAGSAEAFGRTSWIGWLQQEGLLPKVDALLNDDVEIVEDVVWINSSVVGWSCVGATPSGDNNGLAKVHGATWRKADAISVTAGTNDLQGFYATPSDVMDCYLQMQAAARQAGMEFFVATTPPVYPPYPDASTWNNAIDTLNRLVRSTFDPRVVIDFDSGFTPDMFPALGRGRHLNDDGEKLRARRVADILAVQF